MSHNMRVVWRWVVGVQIWMVAVCWWDVQHLPSNVVRSNLSPLDALAVTTAAVAWHAVILLGGLLAEYGLVISVPMLALSEVVHWWVHREKQEMASLQQSVQVGESKVQHGWVPRN